MLKSLSISNYALIESLEIDFPDGLVIITGETGAGKSILLGAISLLLGAKADKEILKDPGKNCVVEALFTIKFDQETLALFKDNDLEPSDTIMLRRVVSPTGRTRSFVNDEPVTNRFLKEISGKIIDIHAQHEHLLIANSNFRMSVLDSYAKNKSQKEEYQQHYNKVKDLNSQLESIKKLLAKEELDFEYNQFQYNQLKEASLNAGELEELEGQQKILANAEEIKNSLLEVNQLLNPNDSSIVQILKEISSIYDKISSSMPNAKQLSQRVESCRIELRELERENIEMAEKTTSDPLRLSAIEERLSLIYDLYKKYHVNSIEGLILVMEDYKTKLSKTTGYKEKIELLESELSHFSTLMQKSSAKLTQSRKEASVGFSTEIEKKIRELEMPYARFGAIVKESKEYTENGKENIEFFFSANKEIDPKEISRIASGGELSRIMLCLKAVMAKGVEMPTMIFDEIDSGVSGSIADKMGNLIDELSQNLQLFTITHLPQIASKGNYHLLVFKDDSSKGATTSKIKRLENEERVLEIARMLSGSQLTSAAIANAKEFLNQY